MLKQLVTIAEDKNSKKQEYKVVLKKDGKKITSITSFPGTWTLGQIKDWFKTEVIELTKINKVKEDSDMSSINEAKNDAYYTFGNSAATKEKVMSMFKERFGEVTKKIDNFGRWAFFNKDGVQVGLSDIDGEGDRTWNIFRSDTVKKDVKEGMDEFKARMDKVRAGLTDKQQASLDRYGKKVSNARGITNKEWIVSKKGSGEPIETFASGETIDDAHADAIKREPKLASLKKHQLIFQKGGKIVDEGFSSIMKSAAKSIKRGMSGWDKEAEGPGGEHPGDPKDIVKRNKGYDDETVMRLAKTSNFGFPFGKDAKAGDKTPRGLQRKVLDREIKKRGLDVKEGLLPGQGKWKKEMQDKGAIRFWRDTHGGGTVDRIVAYDKNDKVIGSFNCKGLKEDFSTMRDMLKMIPRGYIGEASVLHKALDRALSKEKKASPAQVEKNKERWAKIQAESNDKMAKSLGKYAYYAFTAKGEDEPRNPYPVGSKSAKDFDEGYDFAFGEQTRRYLAATPENLAALYNVKDRISLLKKGIKEEVDMEAVRALSDAKLKDMIKDFESQVRMGGDDAKAGLKALKDEAKRRDSAGHVEEGFSDMMKSAAKSVKRASQGWGWGAAPEMIAPKGVVSGIKNADDETLNRLVKGQAHQNKGKQPKPHSPQELGQRVIGRELSKRGMGVKEDVETFKGYDVAHQPDGVMVLVLGSDDGAQDDYYGVNVVFGKKGSKPQLVTSDDLADRQAAKFKNLIIAAAEKRLSKEDKDYLASL